MFKFFNGMYEAAATKVKDAIRAAHDWFDQQSPITKGLIVGLAAVVAVAIVAGCAKSDVVGKYADEHGQVTLHAVACKDAALMAELPADVKDLVKHGEVRPTATGKAAGLADKDFCYAAVDGLVLLVTGFGVMPIGPTSMFGME